MSVTHIKDHRGFCYVLEEKRADGTRPYRILNPDGSVACVGGFTGTKKDAETYLQKTVKRQNDSAGYKTGRHSQKVSVVNGKPTPTSHHDWKQKLAKEA